MIVIGDVTMTSLEKRCRLVAVILIVVTQNILATGDSPLIPSAGVYRSRYGGRCERITIPLCNEMKYNMTRMPNLVGHTSQAEAAMQVHEFVPLIQFGCSRMLKFFLCSLYAPMCTVQVDEPMVIPACRSMCLEVRDKCEPVLKRFNFNWPTVLDCSTLPERSDRGALCIDLPPSSVPGDAEDSDPNAEYPPVSGGSLGESSSSSQQRVGQNHEWSKLLEVLRDSSHPVNAAVGPTVSPIGTGSRPASAVGRPFKPVFSSSPSWPHFRCPDRFVSTIARTNSNSNESSNVRDHCAARCGVDVMFGSADKEFISTWMTIWASCSLFFSLFATLTFLVDPSRFDYPERPVILIAVCCVFYSSAFILRAAVGAEMVSCDRPRVSGSEHQPLVAEPELYIIREGLESVWCLVIFLILYYFGSAAAVWWVLLAVTWFLASARRWSREAIRSYAGYVHLVGWSVPAVQTIVVLAIRRVDGDEMTGMCYVGNQDAAALAGFVLAPLSVYLVVGTTLIGLGFLALFGIRHDLKRTDHHLSMGTGDNLHSTLTSGVHGHGQQVSSATSADIHKLEKLMARIGLFSGVYIMAMCCHLAGLLYQQVRLEPAIQAAMRSPCRSQTWATDLKSVQQSCSLDQSLMSVELHALKICGPLAIGVASGLWMLSSKTLRSWSAFICRCRDRKNRSSAAMRLRTDVATRHVVGARTLPCRSARVQNAVVGGPAVKRTGPVGGRCSKASSYAALNKGETLSWTTII